MPIDHRLSSGAHSFMTPSGATLTYFVHGKGPRTLVNVAPGWGCASILYQNSFTFLNDSFTFVHLEPRGTRGSSFPDDLTLMSSWHMSEDIESLRVHLGIAVLDGLIGHSNGGCIVAWYAIRFPQHVRSLVLLDSQLPDPMQTPEAVEAFRGGRGPQHIPDDAAFAKAMDACLPLYFARPSQDMPRFKSKLFTNVPQIKCWAAQDRVEEQYSEQDSQLDKIEARTLVVLGREDFICPIPVSEMLAARIQRSTLAVIEDSGHFPWIERQERFAAAFKSFFGSL
ncbi:alpha/beta-hydrolase [Exidia glandulosa HHB12029]|uniref:Alpha/beta-hydrolase n=1 Tax=Exidia glandulosa HHB12029 TaxID=1314781 RepID=A0A165E466_EXIGL|nr:alpha/beta-hydrolase [Exidia glandulosa HHB12029]